MKRLFDNLLLDLLAAALMLGIAGTGYILRFPLPPGSNKYLILWGLTRHQWGTVHFWISLALLAVVLLHLALHWQWVVLTVRRKLAPARTAPLSAWFTGLLTLLIVGSLFTLFALAAHRGVEKITEPREDTCPPPAATSPAPTPASKGPIAFWRDVYPILDRACVSCHGPRRQRGDFRADRPGDYLTPRQGKPLVIPGNSAASPLIAILSGKQNIARPDVHRLSAAEVEILRAWIDAGAPWPERPE